MEIHTTTARDTKRLGKEIGRALKQGDVVSISGGLGSGKTCLIQGIAKGIGVNDPVNSPTFTILKEYHGRYPVYHLDLYRIKEESELYELGIEEYLYNDGVVLIEWGERAKALLPSRCLMIDIEWTGGSRRRFVLRSSERHLMSLIKGLREDFSH
jgi:tRNA threonylcarbamoyladenosine biosynthesis protein TsaE